MYICTHIYILGPGELNQTIVIRHRLLPHPTTPVSPPTCPTLLHYHFSLLNRRYGVRADRAAPRSQFFLRLIRLNYVSYVVYRERAETGAITTIGRRRQEFTYNTPVCVCVVQKYSCAVTMISLFLSILPHTHFHTIHIYTFYV